MIEPAYALAEGPASRERLRCRLMERTAKVGVVGAGYVGLPFSVAAANAGFDVLAIDRDFERIGAIRRGESYIGDVAATDIRGLVADGRLGASVDFAGLSDCDVVVICVPTPLTVNKQPDVSCITSAAESIAAALRPGHLIALESTTYPGTTDQLVLPILERSGLRAGKDFFLAFSPERVDPGNEDFSTQNTTKVVGGITATCLELATMFYEAAIAARIVPVSSTRVAEMTKIFENAFRSVNIALVNELAQLCDRMELNVWEVVEAAATKPFGIMRFNPGPGVGGHCIPLDPYYLSWKAREHDFLTQMIETSGQINAAMPYFVRDKLMRTLNERAIPLNRARILAVGVAYKRNCEDWRHSPATKVMELLLKEGARVDYFDPLVPTFRDKDGVTHRSLPWSDTIAAGYDAVIVLTDHGAIDWERLVRHARLVLDTRNATAGLADRTNVVLL